MLLSGDERDAVKSLPLVAEFQYPVKIVRVTFRAKRDGATHLFDRLYVIRDGSVKGFLTNPLGENWRRGASFRP
jgi:hypothetical protein